MKTALISLLALLAVALPAQERQDALEAVTEFRRFFRTYRDVNLQVEAVHTLLGNECAEAADVLLGLLEHRTPEVRAAAMEVLGSYDDPETFTRYLAALPEMKDVMQQARLIEVLGRSKVQAAVPVLAELVGAKKTNEEVLYQVARAFSRIPASNVEGELRLMLGHKSALVRMAATDAVGVLDVDPLAERVVELLEDKSWQVQSAAVGAVTKVRPQSAVRPLIDLLRTSGRIREEAADALYGITLLDFGTDADRWEKQWRRLEGIDWRIPTDEQVAKAKETRKRYDAYYGKKEQHNTFAGIPTTSTRVLFIIDVSGSMDDLVVEREKFDAEYEDFKKITIVKTELARTIDELTKNTRFNIVAFATDLKTWKRKLVPANITNRSSARAFARTLKSIGGVEDQELAMAGLGGAANLAAGKTNTHKALMYMFGIDPDKPSKAAQTGSHRQAVKSLLDTVYFLSDGQPSTGHLQDTAQILQAIRDANEAYRIVIHTIAIGDFQKGFLKGLASQNGGVFVDLGR